MMTDAIGNALLWLSFAGIAACVWIGWRRG
jgi:hypothetical protein